MSKKTTWKECEDVPSINDPIICASISAIEGDEIQSTCEGRRKGAPHRTKGVSNAADYLSPRLRQTARRRYGTPCTATGMDLPSRGTVVAQRPEGSQRRIVLR